MYARTHARTRHLSSRGDCMKNVWLSNIASRNSRSLCLLTSISTSSCTAALEGPRSSIWSESLSLLLSALDRLR